MEPELTSEQMHAVCALLAAQTGQPGDTAYKESCLVRRIMARIRRSGCRDAEQYLRLLAADPEEVERLRRSLLIQVSQFFRNPSLFGALQQQVLPALLADTTRQLTIWSAGCAGGEEPYSVALLLAESFAEPLQQGRLRLLASDSDHLALERAAAGRYPASSLRELTDERRRRFFRQCGELWQLDPSLGRLVTFFQADLRQASQYRPADLILCRNTLIYFSRPAQEKILHQLTTNLPQDGILVLGRSETLPAPLRERLATLNPHERIYRRRS